jgi:CRP/FNR family transcriptional regulator, anaerobic regulatory protein
LDKLGSYFTSQGFSKTELNTIMEAFENRQFRKGDYFVEEGKTSRFLGFIEEGFFQYYIIQDGIEKTIYTVGENNFVVSLVSFFKQIPARENIRAVMDTSVWVIDKMALKKLGSLIPAFKDFYIGILEWQICCIDESRLDAIMLSAKERYIKMIEKEPDLIRQIPLQYLASILGVTPRHLSRIRNEIR